MCTSGFKKYDIIIGNPPYGQPGSGNLHLHYEIVERMLKHFNEKMFIIMPERIISSTSDKYDKFKKAYSQLSSIKTVENTNELFGTAMGNAAIFTFENEDQEQVNVNGTLYKTLFDVSNMTDYEKKMMSYLYNEHPNYNMYKPIGSAKDWNKNGENTFDKYVKRFNNNSFIVLCCAANGAGLGLGKFFSSKDKKLILNLVELKEYCKETNNQTKVFCEFNSFISAQNYVDALKRPLMRFGLIKLQDDQNMTERVYKYVPDIDWSDERCKTDSGILEMCGCNKEDAEEFANYVKEFVERITNK